MVAHELAKPFKIVGQLPSIQHKLTTLRPDTSVRITMSKTGAEYLSTQNCHSALCQLP